MALRVKTVGAGDGRELNYGRSQGMFAAVAVAEDTGKAVGFLSLDDTPIVCNSTASSSADAASAAAGLTFNASMTMFVQQLQAEEGDVLQQLLQHTFVSIPQLRQLLLVTSLDFDADIQQQQHNQQQASAVPDAAATLFIKASSSSSSGGLWLYECSQQDVLPALQVRRARVEDHDDLLPIVAAAAAGPCPSLAALPESCQPDQPFALTRLISSQDSENVVLVAEGDGKLVGLLVATLQLDVSLLMQAFDLGFCDAFMPSDVYEDCEAAAKAAASAKVQQQRQQQDAQGQAAEGQDETSSAPEEPTAEQVREELVPLLLAAYAKRQHRHKPSRAGTAAAAGTAAPPAAHNLAAITMLCMQPGYEARAVDFMPALFDELPHQDYCALTLPHRAPPPPLASHMTMLRPLPGTSFPQVVLLLHRASLALHLGAEWEVRLAGADDVTGLTGLLGSMSNATELQEALLHAVGRQGAVVAAINGELVGMLATSPVAPEVLQSWSAQYELDKTAPSLQDAQQHALISGCCLNPIFAACAGGLLAAAVKLLDKPCLHYVLAPDQPAPAEVLAVMQLQAPRRSRGSSLLACSGPQQGQGALWSFVKGMAHAPKHTVNAQVVVAGASETGLACLERLLLQPSMRFTNITLLAPGGIRTDSLVSQFTAQRVVQLGLHASVTVVDSHMVALDPEQQLLMLADGGQLPYDLLAVVTGLQDQLGPAVAGAFPDAAHFVLTAQQVLASSITPKLAASLQSVLVYGADLAAFDVLAKLIRGGVQADALTWVCPGTEQESPGVALLRSLAAELGVELPEPQQGHLLDLVLNADSTRAVAALQAIDAGKDGPVQQMELDLLVGCGRQQPSAVVASALAGALIVWDGRLVVDAQFCSSNPAVLGAGPVTKFSRRYRHNGVQQEEYNSYELGSALAEAVIKQLLPDGDVRKAGAGGTSTGVQDRAELEAQHQQQHHQPDEQHLPPLQRGKLVGCQLPDGNTVFVCCSCPAAAGSPGVVPPGGCSLLSSSRGAPGVLSITLDARSTIHQIAYMGDKHSASAAAAVDLMALVGLPFSYLAQGLGLPDSLAAQLAVSTPDAAPAQLAGLKAGPQPGVWLADADFLALIQAPWAQLLLHEGCLPLRSQLLQQPTVEGQQRLVLEMLQGCRAELPGYHIDVPQPAVC